MWRAGTSRETALNAVAEGGVKRIRRGSIRNRQSADASFLFPQMSERLNPHRTPTPTLKAVTNPPLPSSRQLRTCVLFETYPLWCDRECPCEWNLPPVGGRLVFLTFLLGSNLGSGLLTVKAAATAQGIPFPDCDSCHRLLHAAATLALSKPLPVLFWLNVFGVILDKTPEVRQRSKSVDADSEARFGTSRHDYFDEGKKINK